MPTPEILENVIYSVEDLVELFGIPYHNMKLLIRRGHIKGAKIGKNWFVTGKSLLKVFEEGEHEIDDNKKGHLSKEEMENDNLNLEE